MKNAVFCGFVNLVLQKWGSCAADCSYFHHFDDELFCERVAVSVCRTINCLFCEDFLPSAYLLLCDLGSGAYLLLCECASRSKEGLSLKEENFASYKESILLLIKRDFAGYIVEEKAPKW